MGHPSSHVGLDACQLLTCEAILKPAVHHVRHLSERTELMSLLGLHSAGTMQWRSAPQNLAEPAVTLDFGQAISVTGAARSLTLLVPSRIHCVA
jgi:hypothetical protein